MQEPSSKSLKEGLFKALNENRFSFGVSKEYFGPKRISINIKNVSPKQLDVVEEKRGLERMQMIKQLTDLQNLRRIKK